MTTNPSRKKSLALIEDRLLCAWYLTTFKPEDWDLTDYDMKYLEKQEITKQLAHSEIAKDMVVLADAFPDDEVVKNAILRINKSLKLDSANNLFWRKEAATIGENRIKRKINEANIQIAYSETTAQALNLENQRRSKRLRALDASASTSSPVPPLPKNEVDNIFVDGIKISVGTLIKNAAIKLHEQIEKGYPLDTPRERKIMSNGLSSILDLNDSSANSQASLFNSTEQWKHLIKLFTEKHPIYNTSIPMKINSIISVVLGTLKKTQTLEHGLIYINNLYYKTESNDRFMLDIFKHLLECVKKYNMYLIKNPPVKIRENDYLRILWSPIYESLFTYEGSKVRVICSESCNSYTTTKKSEAFADSRNIIGFKIDIRVVLQGKCAEYDIACGEVACHDGDEKIIADEGKLAREAKDIQDHLIINNCHDLFAWTIQHVGSSIDVASLHLTTPGLYVIIPRFSFSLPASISELDNSFKIIQNLITLKSYIIDVAEKLNMSLTNKLSNNSSLGKNSKETDMSEKHYWMRDTYYTPPHDRKSKMPTNMYGVTTSNDVLSKLLKASFDSSIEDVSVDACQFGWIEKNGRFYNLYSNEYSDEHPCCS